MLIKLSPHDHLYQFIDLPNRICAINNIKQTASLNRLNNDNVLRIILFSDRRLTSSVILQIAKL